MRLDPETLAVETFAMVGIGGSNPIFCCTGCVSGCGINPTAGGCESGGDKTSFEFQAPIGMEAKAADF